MNSILSYCVKFGLKIGKTQTSSSKTEHFFKHFEALHRRQTYNIEISVIFDGWTKTKIKGIL